MRVRVSSFWHSSMIFSSLVSAMDLSGGSDDELSKIIELPRLESSELEKECVFLGSMDGWMYQPPPWLKCAEEECFDDGGGRSGGELVADDEGTGRWSGAQKMEIEMRKEI